MAGESGPEKVNVQAKTLSETPLPLRLAGATATPPPPFVTVH